MGVWPGHRSRWLGRLDRYGWGRSGWDRPGCGPVRMRPCVTAELFSSSNCLLRRADRWHAVGRSKPRGKLPECDKQPSTARRTLVQATSTKRLGVRSILQVSDDSWTEYGVPPRGHHWLPGQLDRYSCTNRTSTESDCVASCHMPSCWRSSETGAPLRLSTCGSMRTAYPMTFPAGATSVTVPLLACVFPLFQSVFCHHCTAGDGNGSLETVICHTKFRVTTVALCWHVQAAACKISGNTNGRAGRVRSGECPAARAMCLLHLQLSAA